VQRALEKKCPKLRRCKDEGATSVLILENNDISLTNHMVVGAAVQTLVANREDEPDEIFLVDTCQDEWTIWSLYRGGLFWPDEETARRYREISPKGLAEV
jgi:hypothetical protein